MPILTDINSSTANLDLMEEVILKLIIGEQHIEYKEQSSVDEVIERINESLKEGLYFSHFIADGEDVYDEHEEYLERKLDVIEELEVVIKTEMEFMNDVLLSAEEYLKRAIPEVKVLADDFKRLPSSDPWSSFEMLLGGVEWLNDMLKVVCSSKVRPSNWEMYQQMTYNMQAELSNLGKAVEKKNNGQISAIIKNGLLPIFERLEKEFGKTIDSEFVRKDLS